MPRWIFPLLLVGVGAIKAIAADVIVTESLPHQVGIRSAVIEFSISENAKASNSRVVATESLALSDLGQALIKIGQIKPDSKGVTKVSENTYRLTLSYPVGNDGAPFPPEVSLPVPIVREAPVYPYYCYERGITGGAVLKLTLDETGKIKKVETLQASDSGFADSASKAVKKWQFKPATKNGVPIAFTVLQLLTFSIGGDHGKLAPLKWRISPQPCLEAVSVEGNYIPIP